MGALAISSYNAAFPKDRNLGSVDMKRFASIVCGFAIAGVMSLSGCNEGVEVKVAMPKAPAAQAKVQLVSEKAKSTLAAADKLDGKEDHVIGLCYICGLGMDGDAKHAAEVDGYTAHFCSKGCCEEFKSDPEKVILSTEIPAEKK